MTSRSLPFIRSIASFLSPTVPASAVLRRSQPSSDKPAAAAQPVSPVQRTATGLDDGQAPASGPRAGRERRKRQEARAEREREKIRGDYGSRPVKSGLRSLVPRLALQTGPQPCFPPAGGQLGSSSPPDLPAIPFLSMWSADGGRGDRQASRQAGVAQS